MNKWLKEHHNAQNSINKLVAEKRSFPLIFERDNTFLLRLDDRLILFIKEKYCRNTYSVNIFSDLLFYIAERASNFKLKLWGFRMPFKSLFFKNHPDTKSIINLVINSHKQKNLNFFDSMAISKLKLKLLMNHGDPELRLSEIKLIDNIIAKIEKKKKLKHTK